MELFSIRIQRTFQLVSTVYIIQLLICTSHDSFLIYNTSFISLVASMNLSISSKSFLGVTLA